jgi:hypothetical protein
MSSLGEKVFELRVRRVPKTETLRGKKLKTPDIGLVKDQMKVVLSKDVDKLFEAMPVNFRETLLGAGKADRLDLFEDLINDTSSKLYDFIDIK